MSDPQFYAGILVRFDPEAWAEGLVRLAAIEGVVVHHEEPESGRVVATLETEALDQQETLMRTIRALPGVLLAEPVYAYRDADGEVDLSRKRKSSDATEGESA